MRVMYDSVRASGCPTGAQLYAGYVDDNVNGDFTSYPDMVRLFPGARHVSITIKGSPAHMYDVEKGAGTPAAAAAWVKQRRALGFTPTVYCSYAAISSVLAECIRQGVKLPVQFACAFWDGSPTFPAAPSGAALVSKQYDHDIHVGTLNYDISSVVAHWPGVDDGLDPLGGGTPEGDDMQPDERQWLKDLHDRLGKFDTEYFADVNTIAPAVGRIEAAIQGLASAGTGLTTAQITAAVAAGIHNLNITSTVITSLTEAQS